MPDRDSGTLTAARRATAERDASAAAHSARVLVQPTESVSGLRAVAELFSRIWDAPTVAPMPHDLMRSLVHAGGAVHTAHRDGRLVGASVAVFGPPPAASCYSLIAGVSPDVESRGIGFALKLAQRAWALAAGASSMTWTYDPLLRRNAYFNLVRLGAGVSAYLEDFYGEIPDGVNDPETDRLAVTWDLTAPLPGKADAGPAASTARPPQPDRRAATARSPADPDGPPAPPAILAAGTGGEPLPGRPPAAGTAGRVGCWIPDDILALRRADPALARRWRLAARDALGGALSSGWRVTGLAEPGWYVLERSGGAR